MSTENEIPTAKEFLSKSTNAFYKDDLIAFARLHVEAAVKAIVANNSGKMNEADIPYLQKCYPLENIK